MAIHVPGTRALKVLEAAGRRLSFTRAAKDLGLTPAAVSHQIKEFEEQLGFALFARTSRTMQLTEAGTLVYESAVDALADIERAVQRARKLNRTTVQLKVTTCPTMASKWLVPRLERFRAIRPDVAIRIDVSFDLKDFRRDDVDVAIRFGAGTYPGLVVHPMLNNTVFPVCSPALLRTGPRLQQPSDLLHHTLAHDEWSGAGMTWPNWRMWMAAAGVEDFDADKGVHFSDSLQAIQAAIAGDVVALGDFAMVADDLAAGRLVRPFELGIKVPVEFGYFLVYPPESADDPLMRAFGDWVLDEARRTREEIA